MSLEQIKSVLELEINKLDNKMDNKLDNKMDNKLDNINENEMGNEIVEMILNLVGKYDLKKIIYVLKTYYNYDMEIKNDLPVIIKNVKNIISNRVIRNDEEYKKIVKFRFNNKCLFCCDGECSRECCQVAHIWNFADCDENSKYNPDNGLFLCSNIHTLFDKELLEFEILNDSIKNGMVKIILKDNLKNSQIWKYNNKIIKLFPENIPFLIKRKGC